MERLKDFRFALKNIRRDGPWPLCRDISQEEVIGQITGIVSQVDAVLDRVGDPRYAGLRQGYCGLSSDLVRRAAERIGIKTHIMQVMNIHKAYRTSRDDAFEHAFNIADSRLGRFIIDPSFGQFINLETGLVDDGGLISGTVEDHPIALRLLKDGYVPLTDESFRDYLKATSAQGDKRIIDLIALRDVLSNPRFRLNYDWKPWQLDEFLQGISTPNDLIPDDI